MGLLKAVSVRITPAAGSTMTTAQPKRKQYSAGEYAGLAACVGLLAYAALVFLLAAGPPTLQAAANERIVIDWHTGLAIGGYDPVAFFTDGKPVAGNADLELRYGGTIWRFANVGNRAAFAASPDVYMPQYGGFDPLRGGHRVGLARQPGGG